MQTTSIALKIKGHLKVERITDGLVEVLYDDHNDLLPTFANVIRRALAGQNLGHINAINAKIGGSLLATAVASASSIPSSPSNEITFNAIFSETSFNGTLDKLELASDADLFSEVGGLSITKDGNSKLSITWKLTINHS